MNTMVQQDRFTAFHVNQLFKSKEVIIIYGDILFEAKLIDTIKLTIQTL